MLPRLVTICLALPLALSGLVRTYATTPAMPQEPSPAKTHGEEVEFQKLQTEHLHNVVRVHASVISGGVPEGAEAFQELRDLGVRTVISVDGAKPDVELASKFGLRYVHLPHGYDGIPLERQLELAKAVSELDSPIYIHCHHGKHRSPAAASTACAVAGLIPADRALDVLKLAGTSPNYRGLFTAAEQATPVPAAQLRELKVEFQETVEIPPLAQAMVDLEVTMDRVRRLADNNWQTDPKHPDLVATHEVLLLREHFAEMLRSESVQNEPATFLESLRTSRDAALEMEQLLKPKELDPQARQSLRRHLDTISSDCRTCHQQFRDPPLESRTKTSPQ